MKVLLLNGSPHENGCTYTALDEVRKQLEKQGVEAEILHVANPKYAVRGCTGCGVCRQKDHRCVYEEDLVNTALEKMESADGLIVGSPVYYASPNGTMISFLDRFFFAGNAFAHKPAAAVVSARRGGTTASFEVLNKYFLMNQMPVVSSNYWNMVHGNNAEEVKQDMEGLQTMRVLANNMAWMLKCKEAAKQAGISEPENEAKIKTNYIR